MTKYKIVLFGLTLSPSIAPYGTLTNKSLTAHDPILNWVSNYAESTAITTLYMCEFYLMGN